MHFPRTCFGMAIMLPALAILAVPTVGSAEPHAFETTLSDRLGFVPASVGGFGDGGQTTHEQYGVSFCLRFGDRISATAVHSDPAALLGGSGAAGVVTAEHARGVLWSWLLGPVMTAESLVHVQEGAGVWVLEGLLDGQSLGSEFADMIPNLGSDDRVVSVLEITDQYQIVNDQLVFVPETMQTTLIPLPNAAALAAAGLLLLGARRRH